MPQRKSRKTSTPRHTLVKTLDYSSVVELGKSPRNKRALIANYNRLAETVNRQFRRQNKAIPEGTGFTRLFERLVRGRSIRPIKEKTYLTTKQIVAKSWILYRLYNHPLYSIAAAKKNANSANELYEKIKETDWGKSALEPNLVRKRGEGVEEYEKRVKTEEQRRKDNFKQFVASGAFSLLNKTFGYHETMKIFENANKSDKQFAQFQVDMALYVKGQLKLDVAMSPYTSEKLPKEATDALEDARNAFADETQEKLVEAVQNGNIDKLASAADLMNAAEAADDEESREIYTLLAEMSKRVRDYGKRKKGKGSKSKGSNGGYAKGKDVSVS